MINIPSKNISKLDLSRKNLNKIPDEIFMLRNLRKLNLNNNNISVIPKEISKLKQLENIDLSNNRINHLYAKLFELKKLRVINLNNNKIKVIPKQIVNLISLEKLLLSNNLIEKLPRQLINTNIKELDISKNLIMEFPEEIFGLYQLKRLWIKELYFDKFPIDLILEKLVNINNIYCYGNLKSNKNIDNNYFKLSKIRGNVLEKIKLLSSGMIINESVNGYKLGKVNVGKREKTQKNIMEKTRIFVSYSHADSSWLKVVQKNLQVLNFEKKDFELWDDTKIETGKKWKEEIKEALETSKIAILLISTNFLASDFIRKNELPPLLKNAEEKGTVIIPVLISHSRFTKDKNLSQFQALNNPSKPLDSLKKHEQDKIFIDLTDTIEVNLNR